MMKRNNNDKKLNIEKQILRDQWDILWEASKEIVKLQSLIKTPKCLSFQQLENYVRGVYTGEEFDKIFTHISSCHYCRRMATRFRRGISERTAQEQQIAVQEYVLEIATAFQKIEANVLELIYSRIKELRPITFVQYDVGGQINFRMELAEKLNARSLDNLIDPIASVNGDGAIEVVSARLINLSQILEAKRNNLIILGNSEDLDNLSAEPIPEIPIKWNTDIIPFRLPEEEYWQERMEQQAMESWDKLAEITEIREPISAVLMHGAFGEVMPVRWLEKGGYITSNPHPSIDILEQARDLLTPIDPHKVELVGWDKAEYLTAIDERFAWKILEKAERLKTEDLVQHFCRIINAIVTSEINPVGEDARLLCRLLHTLSLRGHRPIAQGVLHQCLDKLQWLVKKLQSDGYDYRYLMAWSKIYGKTGYLDIAQDLLQTAFKIVTLDADKAYLYRVLGVLYMEQGEYGRAIQALEEANSLCPDNINIITALASAYARSAGQGAKARAREFLSKAKEQDPYNPYPYQIYGYTDMHEGFERGERDYFISAAENFKKALDCDEKSVPTLTAWAQMAKERGHLRPEVDQFDGENIYSAEKLLLEALDVMPRNIPALVSIGDLYIELREFNEAEAYLRNAFRNDSTNIKGLRTYIKLKIKMGQLEPARALLKRAKDVDKENPYVLTAEAELAIEEGNLEEAEILLEEALGKEWGRESILVALNLLVKALFKKGEYSKAAARFRDALKEGYTNPQTYNNLAECFLEIGDKDAIQSISNEIGYDSLALCQEAFSFDEHNAYTLRVYGMAEKLLGDTGKGDELLRLSKELGLAIQEDE